MEIQLIPPALSYRASFLRALHEFRHEGLRWWSGGDLVAWSRIGYLLAQTRGDLGEVRPGLVNDLNTAGQPEGRPIDGET